MKATALLLVFLMSLSTSAQKPNDYPLTVHVASSYSFHELGVSSGTAVAQRLDVVIDGKKYVLNAAANGYLIALGDYQARLNKDEHKTAYESRQMYTLRFPDGKTRDFTVVGFSE